MARIEVTEKIAAELQQVAVQDARAVEDVVHDAIHAYLAFRSYEPDLTSPQIERMKHSVAQLDRGEVVTSEQVDAFFDDWEKTASSR